MKKTSLALALFCSSSLLHAAELDTDNKRLSYILGLQIGQQMKSEGVELDNAAFLQALKDVAAGTKPRLTQEQMQATMQNIQKQRMAEAEQQAQTNQKEGAAFLTSNKKKSGVKTLESGLQYKVIKAGKGAKPKATDVVEVNYRGTLINGEEFDSSYSRGQPATFPVNGVIKGWQEALQLMEVGSKWQVFVPSELAYGSRGAGGMIGPNATLIFEVELLNIKK